MTETKAALKKRPATPMGLIGTMTAGVLTTVSASIAAWCFLSVILGVRSIQQHSVQMTLNEIDTLLPLNFLLSPPDWVNDIRDFYTHWKSVAANNTELCLSGISAVSKEVFPFQPNSSAGNPFAEKISQTCSALKTQVFPLLSGTLAVIVLKMWVLITVLPLFLLSLVIGLVDGLVQRDIRKFQGARETTLLFHRIKGCGAVIFFLPLFAYLSWLSPVQPLWFFIPMAFLLGLWIALSLRFFKKYI